LFESVFEPIAERQKQAWFFGFGSHAVVVCILLTRSCMCDPTGRKNLTALRRAGAVALTVLAVAGPALAQDVPRPPHVRGDRSMQRLVNEAARRSPAIREWIDRLEELDVTVYVRSRTFAQIDLEGRLAILSNVGGHRYLVIELACGRAEVAQMATLGHELFHALEIAQEKWVVNAETLAELYSRIGTKTGDSGGVRTFETEAAAAAGLRARQQLLTSTRNGNGT
jgi:hypothetical protein